MRPGCRADRLDHERAPPQPRLARIVPVSLQERVFERGIAGARLTMENAEKARAFLQKYPALCADFEFVKGSMDDVFLSVTGKDAEGGGR